MELIRISKGDIRHIKTALKCKINELDTRQDRFGRQEKEYDSLIEDYEKLLQDFEELERKLK